MTRTGTPPDALRRSEEIRLDFASPQARADWLLCDRHDPSTVAFRLVGDDLQVSDLTYAELAARSRRAAQMLSRHGIGPGDRVATLLTKGPDLPAVILGIWRLGAVYVPLFTAFAEAAVVDRLHDARAKLVVTDEAQAPKLQSLDVTVLRANVGGAQDVPADRNISRAMAEGEEWRGTSPALGPDAPLVQMATSGTTGKPKVVVHPLAYAAGWQSYLELALRAGRNLWCGADPGWAYGLYTLMVGPMASGLPAIFTHGTFKPEATWKVLEHLEVTDYAAAPTALRALRAADPGTDLPHLERISTAGEPLTPEVGEWTRSRFGVDVHDHFGQTELGMTAGFAHHPDLSRPVEPRAMGTSLPGWRMVALDPTADTPVLNQVGRLAADIKNSPYFTFTGYGTERDHRASRFTADGAYYVTGDLASQDESGLIRFAARDDDVILMAGYRIGPFDIESVLVTHPRVAECAVVASPDEVRGEVIHAYVVTTNGATNDALVVDLQTWVRTKYAAHAYPRLVTFVDALPKTPSGKVQRAVLRQQATQTSDGDPQ